MTGLVLTAVVLLCCPAFMPLALVAIIWAEVDRRRYRAWEERQRIGKLYNRIHGVKQ